MSFRDRYCVPCQTMIDLSTWDWHLESRGHEYNAALQAEREYQQRRQAEAETDTLVA